MKQLLSFCSTTAIEKYQKNLIHLKDTLDSFFLKRHESDNVLTRCSSLEFVFHMTESSKYQLSLVKQLSSGILMKTLFTHL